MPKVTIFDYTDDPVEFNCPIHNYQSANAADVVKHIMRKHEKIVAEDVDLLEHLKKQAEPATQPS